MESQPKGGKYLIFLRKGFFYIAKPVLSCFVLRRVLRPFLEPFLAFFFEALFPNQLEALLRALLEGLISQLQE